MGQRKDDTFANIWDGFNGKIVDQQVPNDFLLDIRTVLADGVEEAIEPVFDEILESEISKSMSAGGHFSRFLGDPSNNSWSFRQIFV